jgi:DNA-binding transcriptional ArsR family regulator
MSRSSSLLMKIQALSNETRFKIVDLVSEKEMTAGSIAKRFDLTRPAVSHHISILQQAGLLDERRAGARRFYVVRNNGFDEFAAYVRRFWHPQLQRLKQLAENVERSKKGKKG